MSRSALCCSSISERLRVGFGQAAAAERGVETNTHLPAWHGTVWKQQQQRTGRRLHLPYRATTSCSVDNKAFPWTVSFLCAGTSERTAQEVNQFYRQLINDLEGRRVLKGSLIPPEIQRGYYCISVQWFPRRTFWHFPLPAQWCTTDDDDDAECVKMPIFAQWNICLAKNLKVSAIRKCKNSGFAWAPVIMCWNGHKMCKNGLIFKVIFCSWCLVRGYYTHGVGGSSFSNSSLSICNWNCLRSN